MVLVGYWPLNETSGSTAYDHSGNENHGTLKGGVTQGARGILGQKAYSFDGVDDYVLVNTKTVDGSTSASLGGWAKVTKDDSYGGIFGHGLNINSDGGGITIRTDNTNNLQIYINGYDSDTNPYISYTPTSSFWGVWNHLMATWDGSRMLLYLNGAEISSTSVSFDSINDLGTFYIGRYKWEDSGDAYYETADVSNVRIYNHALTPSEVQYLYSVSKRGRQVSSSKQS